MNRFTLYFGFGWGVILLLNACRPDYNNKEPQYILDQAMKVHGSKVFDQSIIEFKIGKRFYKSVRDHGQFRYERFWDSLGMTIHDELTHQGLIRHVGQTNVILDTKKIDNYSSSLREVMFLFALPFGLNDPTVIKTYLGEVILMEQPYHKIKITFRQNPNDRAIHDDVYVLWIHKMKFTLDYVGSLLNEPEDHGICFRQALEPRKVEGLRIQNYLEFKPIRDSVIISPEDLDQAWIGHQLMEWSRTNLSQLKIRPK